MISIDILQKCGAPIYRPLEIIYKACLEKECVPFERKKASVVPVHKKGDKQVVKTYHLISLLPNYGKILGRLLYSLCTNVSWKIILFYPVNPVLRQEVCVLISFYLLQMKSTNNL